MSDQEHRETGRGDPAREEELVRHLLERAGPRPPVPADDLAAIKEAFRTAWREQLRSGKPYRDRLPGPAAPRRRLLALAAALAVAAGSGLWLWSRVGEPGGDAARVESGAGVVRLWTPDEAGRPVLRPFAAGIEIPPGSEVETATGAPGSEGPGGASPGSASYAALRLGGGASLRLDSGTRLRLAAASEIELRRGGVYVDSGEGRGGGEAVAVRTPLGVATDVGTQFEVRLLGGEVPALRVRVRRGTVRVEAAAAAYSAAAGAELTLDAGGSASWRRVAGHGEPWGWVLRAAPPFDVDGLTVRQFLARVAEETGWTIRYADEATAAAAGDIRVGGTIGDLAPDQAPAAVLPGAGLDHRVVDGVLIVGPAEPES